jgi:hypothetical protein
MLKVLDGTAGVSDVKDTRLPQRKGRQKGAKLVDGRVVYPGKDDGSEGGSRDRSMVMRRESQLGPGLGRERKSSFLSGMAGSQMLMAGLAQDESDDGEDGMSGGELEMGGESGSGRASTKASGLDSGVDTPRSEAREIGQQQHRPWPGSGPGRGRGHLARKNVGRGKKPKRIATALQSKTQIMASVEAESEDDQGGEDPNYESKDEDDGDDGDDDDGDDDEDYDYEAVQDIVEGHMPLARGGTEESEGGDYNPLLESFQPMAGTARRNSSGGPRSREKRVKY